MCTRTLDTNASATAICSIENLTVPHLLSRWQSHNVLNMLEIIHNNTNSCLASVAFLWTGTSVTTYKRENVSINLVSLAARHCSDKWSLWSLKSVQDKNMIGLFLGCGLCRDCYKGSRRLEERLKTTKQRGIILNITRISGESRTYHLV